MNKRVISETRMRKIQRQNAHIRPHRKNIRQNLKTVGKPERCFTDDVLVSVVMAYYNRKNQLTKTLESIEKTLHANVEIVICDDGSSQEHTIDIDEYRFPIILKRIDPKDKWWINPCMSFNKAINNASGELIILQNPECLHHGDIIMHAVKNMLYGQYLVYPCLAIGQNCDPMHPPIPVYKNKNTDNQSSKWYHHPVINPTFYHFASAIPASEIKRINGFDPIFANGIGWDDDEFLYRVKQRLSVATLGHDAPYVIHQYHENFFIEDHKKFLQNKLLYERITKRGGPKMEKHTGYEWFTHLPLLEAITHCLHPDVAIEFGVGIGSTKVLYNSVEKFTAIENSPEWYAQMVYSYPPRDGFVFRLHHLGDTVNLATKWDAIPPSLTESIRNYYDEEITKLPSGKCRIAMIDQYSCCRYLSLALYNSFDVVIFHDCEPLGWEYYNYGAVTFNDQYDRYVFKTSVSWTGLLIRKTVQMDMDQFMNDLSRRTQLFQEEYQISSTDFHLEPMT